MNVRVYVLLRIRDGVLQRVVSVLQSQPGVVLIDPVEGLADLIFAVQASDRERLARLTIGAIAQVENEINDFQLLPSTDGEASVIMQVQEV